MFSNPCLGELEYEAPTAAILMAGLFISFLVEYISHRFLDSRKKATVQTVVEGDKETQTQSRDSSASPSHINEHQQNKVDALNALVLESGIIFHSLRKFFAFPRASRWPVIANCVVVQLSVSPSSSLAIRSSVPSSRSSSSTRCSKASHLAQSSLV